MSWLTPSKNFSRCPPPRRARTQCMLAPAPPPDAPNASVGNRSSFGERRVPIRLQYLHHRWLNEAIEHRRNAERSDAARCLRYLHPPHRLWFVGATKQLSPDRGPVLFEVSGQIIDTHAVDACRALVALHLRQSFLQVLTLDHCFHRRFRHRRASRLVLAARASVPPKSFFRASPVVPLREVISSSVFCRMARARSPPYWPLPPFRPSTARCHASADFCTGFRSPCDNLSLVAETQRRPPEVRSTAVAARPPDLPPRPLMAADFAIIGSLVRPGRPRYPVLVHRAAVLLRASFRPRLATTPLHFANPSLPSGWIEDFHLQAADHARHTKKKPRPCAGAGWKV
jgi:hypothetical protein